jgi:two-component system, chemotaxis family, sensor kinase CheA
MFGFTDLSQFAHDFESVLDRLRNRQIAAAPSLIDLLLRASDMLKSLLGQLRGEGAVDPTSLEAVAAELQRIMANQATVPNSTPMPESPEPPTVPSATRLYEIYFKPAADMLHKGLDALEIFEELACLGEVLKVEVGLDSLSPLTALDPEECYLGWVVHLRSAHHAAVLEEPFKGIHEESVLRIAEIAQPQAPPAPQPSDVPLLGEILFQEQMVTQQESLISSWAPDQVATCCGWVG